MRKRNPKVKAYKIYQLIFGLFALVIWGLAGFAFVTPRTTELTPIIFGCGAVPFAFFLIAKVLTWLESDAY